MTISFDIPMDREPEDERDGLAQTAEYMTVMGTVIAQAGMMFGLAMVALPTGKDTLPADTITDHLRQFTAGAMEDSPVPVTVVCYLARVIKGNSVIKDQPELEDVLQVLEDWADEGQSWDSLRSLYSYAMELNSKDVEKVTTMLQAVRDRLAALPDKKEREE